MGNCLKTTLKAVINNPNLPYLVTDLFQMEYVENNKSVNGGSTGDDLAIIDNSNYDIIRIPLKEGFYYKIGFESRWYVLFNSGTDKLTANAVQYANSNVVFQCPIGTDGLVVQCLPKNRFTEKNGFTILECASNIWQ